MEGGFRVAVVPGGMGLVRHEPVRDRGALLVGDDRCYPLPDRLEDVRASCTPKGQCRVGGTRRVILANSGRDSWDVWLDRETGEGRLQRRTD